MNAREEVEYYRREWETAQRNNRYMDTHGDIRTQAEWDKELAYWKRKKEEGK